jgi:uncharacterized repeat protein (TIGR03803 family)
MLYATMRVGSLFAALLLPHAAGAVSPLTTLYTFGTNSGDGAMPLGTLALAGGLLYGTTKIGGTGDGTVFSVNPATPGNAITTAFNGGQQGATPLDGLASAEGRFYGTTSIGGSAKCSFGCGTIFSYNLATHHIATLYRFQGGSSGANPFSNVIYASGVVYGTTYRGGATAGTTACSDQAGCGTVFSYTIATNTLNVLHSFTGGATDGQFPIRSLTNIGGILYGVTQTGGGSNCLARTGCGTIFKLDITRTPPAYSVVYAFPGGSQGGAFPIGDFAHVDGLLFGVTYDGGGTGCGGAGCGTLFALNPSAGTGTNPVTTLANLTLPTGARPAGGLTAGAGGVLYGTTTAGPTANDTGTIFRFNTTTRKLATAYVFQGSGNGATPMGGLIYAGGTLYGTTHSGGGSINDGGTVFAFKP